MAKGQRLNYHFGKANDVPLESTHTLRSFPRKRESRGHLLRFFDLLRWVPAFAGTSG
jgi:hypothetical protein